MFSMIIPTYNEDDQVVQTMSKINTTKGRHEVQIIVVDDGSTDDTCAIAQKPGATVLKSEQKVRAAQMNKGVSVAKHELLYFLHADNIPHHNFATDAGNSKIKQSFIRANWTIDLIMQIGNDFENNQDFGADIIGKINHFKKCVLRDAQ